jgi:hypothetical protein
MVEIVSAEFGTIVDGHGDAVVAVAVADMPRIIINGVKVVFDNDPAKCLVEAPEFVRFPDRFQLTIFACAVFSALTKYGVKHRLFDPHPAPQSAAEVQ